MLQLRLFGGFSLSRADGQPIEIELAKSRALFAYLALNPGRGIERPQLAALLWGDQPEARARHSLTQAMSSLARALGDDAQRLERGRQQICLQGDGIVVDAVQLQQAGANSEPAELVTAVEGFEPDVLNEFSFDQPGFDEWALLTREALQECALRAGVTYLSLDATQRDAASSLSVARKLLRIDPCFEPAHRALLP